ncbi:hypothetical protein F0365_13955 [Nonlabens sp. Ci31]|uniref:hypothetical protein n=1 Tax=Nonlabens sp. Ci31 TaxID=2608253 RepID=UPI001462E326|nr:hypothetical protein [Nonlabens sp. Ci31]QJP35424.1 hypothetical protein F0365_13955 [Nonlabens sp. Ci31]
MALNFSKNGKYSNTLEIHYYFDDKSHSMNANVQNRCEYEVLGIIKEVSRLFAVDITIETEPIANGGLKKWLKVVNKGENKSATISTAVIVAFLTVLLTTPIAQVTENLIDKIFEDTEFIEGEKEKQKLEIEELKRNALKDAQEIENNNLIKKKKSNFYETLENYPKVKKVSYTITDDDKETVIEERFVTKQEFKKYILVSDDLEPLEIEEAEIEIISPVLKKGKYKWTGYYKGEPISFYMKSNEFKTLVQNGQIEFKNGSSINCFLNIRKKVNNEGIETIVGYDVLRVNLYFQNEKPIETSEGKKHRKKKEADESQFDLFE